MKLINIREMIQNSTKRDWRVLDEGPETGLSNERPCLAFGGDGELSGSLTFM
jgi:hypothetical protein